MALAVIILAAGEGTRMQSDIPKVLHPLAGAPLLAHALGTAAALDPDRLVVVTGPGAAAVTAAVAEHAPQARIAVQTERRGTAHAVLAARSALDDFAGDILILYADTPLIRPATLSALRARLEAGAAAVVLGFEAADPAGYGRLLTEGGQLLAIVEERDADAATRAIRLCNSGVMAVTAPGLWPLLDRIGCANAQGEYYLTDLIALARAEGLDTAHVTCPEAETRGVNSRADLAAAEAAFQARARAEALANGVTLIAPETVHFAHDTVIGRDALVEPFVVFGPGVTVESHATIRAFSHLEGAHVSAGAVVGPHARLRPGAEIGDGARIGNFVEVKAAQIGTGAKVNHLAYVGDAVVGDGANLGAGTITCNFDGVAKHRTEIGPRAFIGSNAALVAPITIGADAMVAAGSTITADVPAEALAVGRARQTNRPGLARRMLARMRALGSARLN